MTPAVRSTVLVIVALAAGITAIWIGIFTKSAIGGEAQDFWREQVQPALAERHAGRARLLHRHKREREERPTRTAQVRVVGPRGAFDGAIVLRALDQDPEWDSFDRRAAITIPPRLYVPPLPEPVLPPPPANDRPERNPDNTARRLVCIAVVVVASIAGGVLSACNISWRGIAHG